MNELYFKLMAQLQSDRTKLVQLVADADYETPPAKVAEYAQRVQFINTMIATVEETQQAVLDGRNEN